MAEDILPFTNIRVGKFEVYTNGSGEVFVKNTDGGVTLRIGDYGKSIRVTAAGYKMHPTDVNGLDAFRVTL
jgi:hypothetical protein